MLLQWQLWASSNGANNGKYGYGDMTATKVFSADVSPNDILLSLISEGVIDGDNVTLYEYTTGGEYRLLRDGYEFGRLTATVFNPRDDRWITHNDGDGDYYCNDDIISVGE